MTPIAQMLAKDSLLPVKQRRYGSGADELGIFDELHFFEVTNVFKAACDLANTIVRRPHETLMRYAFLPAPRTLLEFRSGSVKSPRSAFLLEQADETSATVRQVWLDADGSMWFSGPSLVLPLIGSDEPLGHYHIMRNAWKPEGVEHSLTHAFAGIIYALLAMINTPRIIGRRQHMPHRGLEKSLLANRGVAGRFPLQAWTEIVLEVRPPQSESGEPHEAHFTGQRALHFCRCHLRIRLGRLELVSAHWRGDGALGIKQTRYRLELPRGRAA